MNANTIRTVRRQLAAAGYTKEQIAAGLAYAKANDAVGAKEGLSLAASRILYSDAQLEDGARFAVA